MLFSRSSSSSSRSAASAEMTWHQQASDSAEQPQLPSDVMAPGEQHSHGILRRDLLWNKLLATEKDLPTFQLPAHFSFTSTKEVM